MSNSTTLRHSVAYTALEVIGVAFALVLLRLHSYLLFHNVAEGFSIVVALGMFAVAWHTRKFSQNSFLLFLGIAYGTVAGIDFLHTLSYQGMGVFLGNEADRATQLWIAARFVQSLSLLATTLFLQRRFNVCRVLILYATVFLLVVATIMWWKVFPSCFVQHIGLTLFKKIAEYVIIGIFAVALLLLHKHKKLLDKSTYQILSASIVITMLSELTLTFYSDPYGFFNLMGHLLKVFAFFLTYQAIVAGALEKPYALLFSTLSETNAQLRSSDDRFRKFFELSGGGKAETEPESGKFIRVNERLCAMTGYNKCELLCLTNEDITYPEDRGKNKQSIEAAIRAEQKTWALEKRYVRKDGKVVWVAVYGTVVQDDSGRPLYNIADIIDISVRKATETKLQFHANVLKQIEDMVIMVDPNRSVTYMNRRAGEEYGVDPEVAIGKHLSLLLDVQWISPNDKELCTLALEEHGLWQGENIHLKNSGEKIVVQSTVSLVRTEKGIITGLLAVMSNVTAHKETEREIASLAKFPEEDPFPVMRIGNDGTILYANKPALTVLKEGGCGIGATLCEDRCGSIYRAVKAGTPCVVEMQHSNEQWCSLAFVPVCEQNYINVYGRDITDTKAFEDALIISEQRYALAQRAAHIGTWDWHIPSGKLHWSEQIEPLFGVLPGRFGNTYDFFASYIHPDDRQRVTDATNHSLSTGCEYNIEHRIVWPDGTVRWVLGCALVLPDKFGNFERMVGIVTDITLQQQEKLRLEKEAATQAEVLANTKESLERIRKQKQAAEDKLQQRQQALESIYTILTSPGSSQDFICDQVVVNIATILKLDAVVFYQIKNGKIDSPVQFINGVMTHEERLSGSCSACEAVIASGKPFSSVGDLLVQFPDSPCFKKDRFGSYISVPVITYELQPVGMICAMRHDEREFKLYEIHLIEIFARYVAYELTRRTMEEKMRQSQEMHLLGQLTSGVAHEVRNPLNALMATSEALFKRMGSTDIYSQYMMHIRNQIKRLSRLMEDLLAFGRPLRNADFTVVTVGTLLSGAINEWISMSPNRGNKVFYEISSVHAALVFYIDVTKVQQVIINILDNAEHHMSTDGAIFIVVNKPKSAIVQIVIRDNGSGVLEDDLPHLFDPFFTTRKSGTGLGLSIVKNTIENHGGKIRVFNNQPPPGASVEIMLPIFVDKEYSI